MRLGLISKATSTLGIGLSTLTALHAQEARAPRPVLEAEAQSVIVQVDNNPAIAWSLVPGLDVDRYPLRCEAGETRRIAYRSTIGEVVFDLSGRDIRQLDIVTPDGAIFRNEARCTPGLQRFEGSFAKYGPKPGASGSYLRAVIDAHPRQATTGAIVGVWADGRQLLSQAAEFRHEGLPSTTSLGDTRELFEFASVSKEFTAVIILQLVEAGHIDLDDPLDEYIHGLPYGRAVTIRHLLTHTSGLRNPGTDPSEPYDKETALAALAKQWPSFRPGSDYRYGNAGMLLLSMVAEQVTGENFHTLLSRRILEPAGMTETRFLSSFSAEQVISTLGGFTEETGMISAKENSWHPAATFGFGDLVGTARDLRRWHVALKNGALLSRDMLELATTPFVFPDGRISERGFAFNVGTINGQRLVFNSGDGLTHTRHAFLLDQDVSVIVNSDLEIDYDDDQPSDLRNQLLGALLRTDTISVFGEAVSLINPVDE